MPEMRLLMISSANEFALIAIIGTVAESDRFMERIFLVASHRQRKFVRSKTWATGSECKSG